MSAGLGGGWGRMLELVWGIEIVVMVGWGGCDKREGSGERVVLYCKYCYVERGRRRGDEEFLRILLGNRDIYVRAYQFLYCNVNY